MNHRHLRLSFSLNLRLINKAIKKRITIDTRKENLFSNNLRLLKFYSDFKLDSKIIPFSSQQDFPCNIVLNKLYLSLFNTERKSSLIQLKGTEN